MWMSGQISFLWIQRPPLGGLLVLGVPPMEPRKGVHMGRIAIFIDAAYLRFMLKDEFGRPRIDFQKLVTRMPAVEKSYIPTIMTANHISLTRRRSRRAKGSVRRSGFIMPWTGFHDFRCVSGS